jgi:crossover junction endodeoxyribonuclease RusA
MDQFFVTVYALPAPQGSKRFMGTSKGGRAIITNTSPALTPWRNEVVASSIRELDALGRPAPFSCAVSLEVHFSFLRPKSATRSKRPYMSIAPDLSKLVRSTEDGLKDAGVFQDDALIVQLIATKQYVNEGPGALDRQGARITVRSVVPWDLPPGRGRLELEA